MKPQVNGTPHVLLVIMGIPAIFLGTSGFATMKAWMPAPNNTARVGLSIEKLQVPLSGAVAIAVPAWPTQAERNARARHARVKCAQCGVVEATREITQLADGIDSGASAWMPWSGRGEMPRTSVKSYEVTVLMKDGSSRVFTDSAATNWRLGKRVVLIESSTQSKN